MILNGRTRHSLGRAGIVAAIPLVAATLCAPSIFAQAEGEPQVKQLAPDAKGDAECKPYVLAYNISDLPVWSKGGDFAPEILMSMIVQTIDPASWEGLGGPSTMAPYEKRSALVISTTAANHEAIANSLEALRRHLR